MAKNILLTPCARYIALPLENKIHIFAPPCNILYIHLDIIIEELLAAVAQDNLTIVIGSLSDDDGDDGVGSQNSEKAIGL